MARRVPPAVLREQQEALDAQIAQAEEALSRLPAVRRGLDRTRWRAVAFATHPLLHSNPWHLLGNLALLVLLGLHLEPALGRGRMAGLLLGGALGAGAGFVAAPVPDDAVLIGTSGLLAGLVAVFAWSLRGSRGEPFYLFAVSSAALWLIVPPALGVHWSLDFPGAAWWVGHPPPQLAGFAALGGVAGAAAVSGLLRLLGGAAVAGVARFDAHLSTGDVDLDAALAARAQGRHDEAFRRLREVVSRGGDSSVDAALALADVARTLRRPKDAEAALLHAVRLEARREDAGAAVDHWLEIARGDVPRGAEPPLLLRMAALLAARERPRAAAEALRAALDRARGDSAASLASRVARAAEDLDPVLAHDAAWKALAASEISLEERQSLEALLARTLPRLPGAEVLLSQAWEGDGRRPISLDVEIHTRVLDAVHAAPLELDEDGIHIATRGGHKKRVLFERIEAVAVAAIEGLGDKPVLVVDLVLDWTDTRSNRLRVIRLRADRFDPRRLVPGEASPVEAMRRFVGIVIDNAQATPLPDPDSARGRPYATFEELGLYERTVLMADAPLSENSA